MKVSQLPHLKSSLLMAIISPADNLVQGQREDFYLVCKNLPAKRFFFASVRNIFLKNE